MAAGVTERHAPRIAKLDSLPLFLKLEGARTVVVGGSEAAAWKAELLAAAGARVAIFAADVSDEMRRLVRLHDGLELVERAWRPADLSGAALAVAAIEEDGEAARFAAAARALGVPFNVVDRPAFSPIRFGAIVNRSPVVIGIGTDGVAPVIGQAVRGRIEAILPPALAAWGAAARRLRAVLAERIPEAAARRAFWRRFAERAMNASDAPADAEIAGLLRDRGMARGSVAFVGAGPGDPELLTLKALRLLQSADVILHDPRMGAPVLERARREARRIAIGGAGHGEDIAASMIPLARAGGRVVRLTCGDPAASGRVLREIEICRAEGVAIEIVPGVLADRPAGVSTVAAGEAQTASGLPPGGRAAARFPDPTRFHLSHQRS